MLLGIKNKKDSKNRLLPTPAAKGYKGQALKGFEKDLHLIKI